MMQIQIFLDFTDPLGTFTFLPIGYRKVLGIDVLQAAENRHAKLQSRHQRPQMSCQLSAQNFCSSKYKITSLGKCRQQERFLDLFASGFLVGSKNPFMLNNDLMPLLFGEFSGMEIRVVMGRRASTETTTTFGYLRISQARKWNGASFRWPTRFRNSCENSHAIHQSDADSL